MAALGLQNYWEKRFLKRPKCEGYLDTGIAKPRLTLANLFSAFLLLMGGMGISCFVFVIENIWFFYNKNGRKETNTTLLK